MSDLLSLISDEVWREYLSQQVSSSDLIQLSVFLAQEHLAKKRIYPEQKNWFRAINELPLEKVKVVIIGQDPYHGVDQAHGFSFSVPADNKIPPSLRNIFKELESDLNVVNTEGDLSAWVEQGVLLLNTTLTVEHSKAGSHAGQGWEEITNSIIKLVSTHQCNVVFMLWGAHAQNKKQLIDEEKHCVLLAPHPSPLSAYRGWFGCRHFSKANEYLIKNNQLPIDWQLPRVGQSSLF